VLPDGVVVDEERIYIDKALESLASARADFAAMRFNSCANRSYFACFQAAVAALVAASIRPADPKGEWSHEFVQSQFNGRLVNRRKLYPPPLRGVLRDTIEVRDKADYTPSSVNERVARRVLREAEDFVCAIEEKVA
jgi:uncharacterized protein (UPF0332 family)